MMNIKEFIISVRNRPQMYIEEIRLDYIYYLVIGFLGSNLINKDSCIIDQNFKSHFFKWVLKWVKKNVDKEYEQKSFFWYHIFNEITSNEEEAVELFFNLCDEFFEEFKK